MRARKKSPKPIGKIFGCKNGVIKSYNIEQKAPAGDITTDEGYSGSGGTHYVITNLVLFLILYYFLH